MACILLQLLCGRVWLCSTCLFKGVDGRCQGRAARRQLAEQQEQLASLDALVAKLNLLQ